MWYEILGIPLNFSRSFVSRIVNLDKNRAGFELFSYYGYPYCTIKFNSNITLNLEQRVICKIFFYYLFFTVRLRFFSVEKDSALLLLLPLPLSLCLSPSSSLPLPLSLSLSPSLSLKKEKDVHFYACASASSLYNSLILLLFDLELEAYHWNEMKIFFNFLNYFLSLFFCSLFVFKFYFSFHVIYVL